MRIQATERSRHACQPARRVLVRSSGGFDFLHELKGAATHASGDAGPQAATAVSGPIGMVMVQEVESASLNRRRAKRRAETLLDRLEDLRRGILLGAVPLHTLGDLSRLIDSERVAVDDPQLAAVLDQIDLRVRVELAKLEVARDRTTGQVSSAPLPAAD